MAGVTVRSWRAILLASTILGHVLPASAARDAVTLAQQYESGLSVVRDYGRAFGLYCEAARSGDPRAFYGLGWM